MIRRIDVRDVAPGAGPQRYRQLVPRGEFDVDAALAQVRPVCAEVRERGRPAILEHVRRFDGVALDSLRVPVDAIARALSETDANVRAAMEESIRRLRAVSEVERESDTAARLGSGGSVTQRIVPYSRAGVHVPGGLAPLASSAIMTIVPAQVAGVGSIAVASPPQKDFGGLPHPTVLAVCALLGVEEVYAVGGGIAIAMFAYGAEGIDPVDFVAGPGRITTVAAKRLLKGVVGIDSEAGPSEVAILADDTADPVHVAADLISQAEHDPMAASVLVTPSEPLVEAVERELVTQVEATKHRERILAALGGLQSAVVLVTDLDQGQEVLDAYAAEHLELQTVDAAARARTIRNAGAIFVGPWAPVSLGDYCAGSNHVLPTGAAARHSSGLSVRSFCKAVHVVEYSRDGLREVAAAVENFADAEDLPAHGAAIRARFS